MCNVRSWNVAWVPEVNIWNKDGLTTKFVFGNVFRKVRSQQPSPIITNQPYFKRCNVQTMCTLPLKTNTSTWMALHSADNSTQQQQSQTSNLHVVINLYNQLHMYLYLDLSLPARQTYKIKEEKVCWFSLRKIPRIAEALSRLPSQQQNCN